MLVHGGDNGGGDGGEYFLPGSVPPRILLSKILTFLVKNDLNSNFVMVHGMIM